MLGGAGNGARSAGSRAWVAPGGANSVMARFAGAVAGGAPPVSITLATVGNARGLAADGIGDVPEAAAAEALSRPRIVCIDGAAGALLPTGAAEGAASASGVMSGAAVEPASVTGGAAMTGGALSAFPRSQAPMPAASASLEGAA